MTSFKDFNLNPNLLRAIEAKGFEMPSEIQEKAIPLILNNDNHVVGKAQTGTGKTAAFGLPILEMIDSSRKQIQALVVVPTRELAIQVTEELNSFARHLGIKVSSVYGGQSYSVQIKHFRNGDQVIVGTPGRLIDHLNNEKLDLSTVDYVVLDEADEMLNMGFVDDVDAILSHAPDNKRVFLFSATMKKKMVALIDKHMPSYDMVEVEAKFITTDLTKQMYLEVNESQKARMIKKIRSALNGNENDKTISVLGLTFKPETDDMRESPSIDIINGLLEQNANIFAYDPAAMDEAKKIFSDKINYLSNTQECISGKDILVVLTEWNEFRALNPSEISKLMKGNIVVDLRNIFDTKSMQEENLNYISLGKNLV